MPRSRIKECCSVCGKVRQVVRRDDQGMAICHPCYRANPKNHKTCSCCSRIKYIEGKDENELPLCATCYHKKKGHKHSKEWRLAHPGARNQVRRNNYRKGAKWTENSMRAWTDAECEMILAPNRPSDKKLAERIRRTVQAIQVKRVKLQKNKGKDLQHCPVSNPL